MIYDPRQASTTFKVYASQYKAKEDEDDEKKEKKIRNIGLGLKGVELDMSVRANQRMEAQQLSMIRDPNSVTGFKYKMDETPAPKGLKNWLKHRYRKPEDRVVMEERTPEAKAAENKIAEEQKESFPKPTLDNTTPQPVATSPSLLDESVYKEYLGRKDESGRFLNKDIQAIYDETYEEGLRKRGLDLDLTPIKETTKEVTRTISQAPKYNSFGDLVKARDTAEKGSALYQDVQGQINTLYKKGGGTYEGAIKAFDTMETASTVRKTTEAGEDILGAVKAVDAGEELATTAASTVSESAGESTPGLRQAMAVKDLYSTWSDDDLVGEEKIKGTVETGADLASTYALASGNPYAMAAGGLYKVGKTAWDLLT